MQIWRDKKLFVHEDQEEAISEQTSQDIKMNVQYVHLNLRYSSGGVEKALRNAFSVAFICLFGSIRSENDVVQ